MESWRDSLRYFHLNLIPSTAIYFHNYSYKIKSYNNTNLGCLDGTSTNGTSTEHFYPHGTSTKRNVHLDISSFEHLDPKWTDCTSTPKMELIWDQMSLSDISSCEHLNISNQLSTFNQPIRRHFAIVRHLPNAVAHGAQTPQLICGPPKLFYLIHHQ